MGLTYGSLFSGIGGLDLAVEAVFGAEAAWHCEVDANASKVLPTSATGCSSSVSRGTPSARAAKGANSVRVASGETRGLLENQVATIPTPQARDGNHGGPQGKRYLNPERSNDLDDFVDALTKGMLLPTPRSQNGEPRNNKVWARPLDQPQNLENALALLPTPMAGDAKSARNSTATRIKIPPTGIHAGDTLTDILVPKKSTGAATKPPSDDGSPSPDQPPPLLTAEAGCPPASPSG